MHACPKCGFPRTDNGPDCARCGVVFARYEQMANTAPPLSRRSVEAVDDEIVSDGTIGPAEWKVLGFGLVAASVVYAIPLTRMMFSALVTLCHELGHTVVGWLLGHPSLPAFDFVYGGGFTHQGTFHLSIALLIAGGFAYALWLFRENRVSVALIATLFLVWLFFVSGEWRRELAIAAAGHAGEFILAGILFYQALAGVGWRNPELERPLGAFAAFFIQIHSMLFAWRLMHDADFLEWYREGKGGALMNDLEVVALDLQIYLGMHPGIVGVARMLLVFSVVPMIVGIIWYLRRAQWHRVLRALRTVSTSSS